MTWQADATAALDLAETEWLDHIAPAVRDLFDADLSNAEIATAMSDFGWWPELAIVWAWRSTGARPAAGGESSSTALTTAATHLALADGHFDDAADAIRVGLLANGLGSISPLTPWADSIPVYTTVTEAIGFNLVALGWVIDLDRRRQRGAAGHVEPAGAVGYQVAARS